MGIADEDVYCAAAPLLLPITDGSSLSSVHALPALNCGAMLARHGTLLPCLVGLRRAAFVRILPLVLSSPLSHPRQ